MSKILSVPMSDNWATLTLQAALSVAVIWGAWFFGKSKKLKKADEASATVSVAKEMIQVMDLATSGFKDELIHVRLEFKQLQDKYIELSIQVGVLTRENDRKDAVIDSQKKKIFELEKKIKELELSAA